eukprot:13280830-Alexandrium_andersonii.AAC.1
MCEAAPQRRPSHVPESHRGFRLRSMSSAPPGSALAHRTRTRRPDRPCRTTAQTRFGHRGQL